jgi:adenosylmethionine-8-amino-7-oxononanoate aminotransferase
MEPIVLNLGVLIPDADFMERVQQLCRRYGTLLVMDEVATGFGRTGKLFASEHFGIEPDVVCLAKAISGGHAGMGATVVTRDVADSLAEAESAYWSMYGWHPISVAAAIANIAYLRKNQKRLLSNVLEMGEFFRGHLARMELEALGARADDSCHRQPSATRGSESQICGYRCFAAYASAPESLSTRSRPAWGFGRPGPE